jgi:hypothetical protein
LKRACLFIESLEDDPDYCILIVSPKGKIPSTCEEGATATVTAVVRYFMGYTDLVDAKISCR